MANYPNMVGFQAPYVMDEGIVPYTPTALTAAGTVVVVGSHVGITKLDIPANALGEVHTKGVFAMPKATGAGSGAALAFGTDVYWDATNHVVTVTATGNNYLGWVVQQTAPADADTNVLVKLHQ